jgi:uncharacterized YccA/Bax inhibitor family protein
MDFKSSNPVISEKIFDRVEAHEGDVMTVRGTMNKFGIMFLMVLAGASFTWDLFFKGEDVRPWMWGSLIGGFVVALVIMFKRSGHRTSPWLMLHWKVCFWALYQPCFMKRFR